MEIGEESMLDVVLIQQGTKLYRSMMTTIYTKSYIQKRNACKEDEIIKTKPEKKIEKKGVTLLIH